MTTPTWDPVDRPTCFRVFPILAGLEIQRQKASILEVQERVGRLEREVNGARRDSLAVGE